MKGDLGKGSMKERRPRSDDVSPREGADYVAGSRHRDKVRGFVEQNQMSRRTLAMRRNLKDVSVHHRRLEISASCKMSQSCIPKEINGHNRIIDERCT